MIEWKETAVHDSLCAIDELVEEYNRRNVADYAVAAQLRGAIMSGINVQTSGIKDMTDMYESAIKDKRVDDAVLLADLIQWHERLQKSLCFNRIWKLCLNGKEQSILLQRYMEQKTMKEIIWRGHIVSRWDIERASTKGIEALQRRMEREGFSE